MKPEGFRNRHEEETGGRVEISEHMTHIVDVDVMGEQVRDLRREHSALSDEAWVKRVLKEHGRDVQMPEGYQWSPELEEEIRSTPIEGVREKRNGEQPPPPIIDQNGPVAPNAIYVRGLKWQIGKKIAQGGFGSVYEVRHGGGKQRKRLVKLMAISGDRPNKAHLTGLLWNEIGAAMAAGDYVGDEVVYDESDGLWIAFVMERHRGSSLKDVVLQRRYEQREPSTPPVAKVVYEPTLPLANIQQRIEHPLDTSEESVRPSYEVLDSEKAMQDIEPSKEGAKWMYKQAMALRSVVSVLRRMHAQGWIHRDIKSDNVIVNLNDGEESLSRPIDFGIAERAGAIRRFIPSMLTGTISYMLPESVAGQNADRRIEDYWGAMLSTAEGLGLVDMEASRNNLSTLQILYKQQNGTYLHAPQLAHPADAEVYFRREGIGGVQQEFMLWVYRFILPHMNIEDRQSMWRERGVTKTLDLPPRPEGLTSLDEEEEPFLETQGDFLDDDRFVDELEGFICRLAQEAQMPIPDRVLEQLQEFPDDQTVEERILVEHAAK
ncbi:hypothetical protein CO174_04670 [Candidatus Uhrbacteria bacterium CG_4_9_14_3_um_filter_50_9]|uniref:Protein kinase domain-containing protein n=1 Tax=Candidatus Uhrbacteria bacterium CG_4_9_14_3_um_filter_50_9 TaxID=1975035 RepID=A0A2M7XB33_9BACT|nr:MAG: hypothetical protein CO174_04670 [Candidatus Uhrbacteria bacterium CG_4_9_14_3_um_filter_50_9]